MKSANRILALLLALSCCSPLPAMAWGPAVGMIGFGETATSYLISESFNGAGYDLADWIEVSTPNEDYATAPAPLEGAQSLLCDGSSATQSTRHQIGSDLDEAWAYFMVNIPVLPASDRDMFYFYTAAGSALMRVQIRASGALLFVHGTANAATTGTLSAGTTYHVWVHYKKGSGADGVADVAFSTDGVRPTSGSNFKQITNGSLTGQAGRVLLASQFNSSGVLIIYDKLRVDDVSIGDNPS